MIQRIIIHLSVIIKIADGVLRCRRAELGVALIVQCSPGGCIAGEITFLFGRNSITVTTCRTFQAMHSK